MSEFFSVFTNGFNKIAETFKELPESFSYALSDPSTLFGIAGVLILIVALIKIRKVKLDTKTLTMIAIAVALTTVLKMFKLWQMPNGGSVTMGSMIPILLLALVYGTETGLLAGFIYGVIDFMLGPWIVHPVQVLFDYPLPFMMLGLAGMFKEGAPLNLYLNKFLDKFIKSSNTHSESLKLRINCMVGIFVAILARCICHIISGVVFFADSAKGMSPYLYSFLYNAGFLSAEFLICIVVMSILPLKRIMKSMVTASR